MATEFLRIAISLPFGVVAWLVGVIVGAIVRGYTLGSRM